ncbi:MAG: ATP-binding protein [Gammaproteobacteria bacterium]|nr:MAG: ATP-binding protein [Gammaproteobacteria bacterium]
MSEIIGRRDEIEVLKSAINSKEAELIAIFGRRRIGKTYLIRNYYGDRIAFELTGMNNGTLNAQLLQFSKSLQQATNAPLPLVTPESWASAFAALEQILKSLS